MGTNKNENIHRQLRSFVPNKLGVETAKALVTHIFYAHNMKLVNKIVPPIWTSNSSQKNTTAKTFVQYHNRVIPAESVDEFYDSIEVEPIHDHDYCCESGKLSKKAFFIL